MAYSDYGGYAYRNGQRIEERSDAVLTEEGLKSTPGLWPGFVIPEGKGGNCFHVILGDGPIHVGMYKQSSVTVFDKGEPVSLLEMVRDKYPDAIKIYEYNGEKEEYIDDDWFRDFEPLKISIKNHNLEIHYIDDDNYYVYVKLTQPDGVEWCGFSGYGVGAGLEDAGYGYSTSEREEDMWRHLKD